MKANVPLFILLTYFYRHRIPSIGRESGRRFATIRPRAQASGSPQRRLSSLLLVGKPEVLSAKEEAKRILKETKCNRLQL